jgi:hypothetical protein
MNFPAPFDLICLLANPNETVPDDVPTLRPTPVQKLAVLELVLAAQMVLREYVRIGHILAMSNVGRLRESVANP